MRITLRTISRAALTIFVVFSVVGLASPLFASPLPSGIFFGTRITTFDTANTYAIADSNYLQGGHMQVPTHAALLAITPERRSVGMLVTVIDDDAGTAGNQTVTYRLVSNRGGASCGTTVTDSSFDGLSTACATTVAANWAVVVPAITAGNIGQVLTAITDTNGNNAFSWSGVASGGGTGTVTSVGLSLPSIFSVSGSPVTGAGTLSATLATQTANTIFAGPTSGGSAAPTFRTLVAADLPASAMLNTLSSGSIWVGNGSNVATAVTLSGDATLDNTGALTLASTGTSTGVFTNPTVTVDAKGRITGIVSGSSTGVSSVSNADGTLVISPTSGAVVASLDISHANTWTGLQTFSTTSTATSGTTYGAKITPTYNQVGGTASNIDLYINRTSTSVGSGVQKLISAQTNGSEMFYVTSAGNAGVAGILFANTVSAISGSFSGKLSVGGGGTSAPTLAYLLPSGGLTANANNQALGLDIEGTYNTRTTASDNAYLLKIGGTMVTNASNQNLTALYVAPSGGFASGVTGSQYYDAQFVGGGKVHSVGLIQGDQSFQSSSFTASSIVITNASKTLTSVPTGTTGQVLTVDGSGNIGWAAPSGGAGTLTVGDAIASAAANQIFFADGSGNLAQSGNLAFTTGTNPIFKVGDVAAAGNNTLFTVNDSSSTMTLRANNFDVLDYLGNHRLQFDTSPYTKIGDIDHESTGTYINIDAGAGVVTNTAGNLRGASPSGASYLAFDQAFGGQFSYGDLSGWGNGSKVYLNDPAKTIAITAGNGLTLKDASGNLTISTDGNHNVSIGDVSNTGNGIKIVVDNGGGSIRSTYLNEFFVQTLSGNKAIKIASNEYKFGDIDGTIAQTYLSLTPSAGLFDVNLNGTSFLGLDRTSQDYYLGDKAGTGHGTYIEALDATSTVNLHGTVNISSLSTGTKGLVTHSTTGVLGQLSNGTTGQILTIDGSGNMIWGAAGSGSLSIGASIGGATPDQLFFADSSGLLAQSQNLTFIDGTNPQFYVGDVAGAGNGSTLGIDDSAKELNFSVGGHTYLDLNPTTIASSVSHNFVFGDTDGSIGAAYFNISHAWPTSNTGWNAGIDDSATGKNYFKIARKDAGSGNTSQIYNFGDANGSGSNGPALTLSHVVTGGITFNPSHTSANIAVANVNYLSIARDAVASANQTNSYKFGDLAGTRGLSINITDASLAGDRYLKLGDVTGTHNGTKLTVDDAASLSTFTNDLAVSTLATSAPGLVLHDASGKLTEIGLGTTGQVLSIDGSGNPYWTTGGGGGGGLAIGTSVTGGSTNSVLYTDGSGALAQSSNFKFYQGTNPELIVGDPGSAGNGTFLDLNDSTSTFGVGSLVNGGGLSLNFNTHRYTLGDNSIGGGTHTSLDIDGSSSLITFASNIAGGSTAGSTLVLDGANQRYTLGDVSGLGSHTTLMVDDQQHQIGLSAHDGFLYSNGLGDTLLRVDAVNNQYSLGNLYTSGTIPYIAGLSINGTLGYAGINTRTPTATLDIRGRNAGASGAIVFSGSGVNDLSVDASAFTGAIGDVVTATMTGMRLQFAGSSAGISIGDTITNIGPSVAAGSTGVVTAIIDGNTIEIGTISGSFPVTDYISHPSFGGGVPLYTVTDIFTVSSSGGTGSFLLPTGGTPTSPGGPALGYALTFDASAGHHAGDTFTITAVPGFTLRTANSSGDMQLGLTDDGRFTVHSSLDMSLYGGTGRANSLNFNIDQANGVYAMGDLDNLNLGEGFVIADGGPTGTDWNALLVDTHGQYFRVAPSVGVYGLGDLSGAYSGTNIGIDDLSGQITSTISSRYRVIDPSSNEYLSLDVGSGVYSIGDISGAANGTKLNVADSGQSIVGITNGLFAVNNVAGNSFLSINQSTHTYGIGDLTSTLNGTQLVVDDNALTVDITGDLHVVGSGATCDLGTSTSGAVCTSDARLKTNVQSLTSALDQINQLRPVTFNWIDLKRSGATQIGFIAQDVQGVFPQFVHNIGKDGYLGIDYAGLIAPAVKAIQELDIKIEPLTTLDVSNDHSLASLIRQYLENALNGIGTIFAGKVQTKELCLDDVCLTKDQLKALLLQANLQQRSSSDPATSGGVGAPVGDSTASGSDTTASGPDATASDTPPTDAAVPADSVATAPSTSPETPVPAVTDTPTSDPVTP